MGEEFISVIVDTQYVLSIDKNECELGIDTCSQNTLGSYTCSCTGYELNIDGNTCSGMHMISFLLM